MAVGLMLDDLSERDGCMLCIISALGTVCAIVLAVQMIMGTL